MTKLAELIEIPKNVHKGDFVLKLSEGVSADHAVETLRNYVITPQLVECFDDALAFIRDALATRASKAAYLHGSFGSGKSHFMAVLHLLLQHNSDARGRAELAEAMNRHSDWLNGKKFLLVPFHMIGEESLESAIFGQYVRHLERVHPGAPIPGVYLADQIFADARNLRTRMGDQAFFEALNEGKSGASGWGALAAAWTPEKFDEALTATLGSDSRGRLVGDLVSRFFKAYRDSARAGGHAFVPLDDGLAILSKHAKNLGYDALILFLDELILWLASHVADMGFVQREGSKLAKLVEAADLNRPAPIISFVARQRDLREFVGDSLPGANKLSFSDSLSHWEGRFHKITLEDRNLPAIVEKRLLRPKSAEAATRLDQAFNETTKVREEIMNTLLTSKGHREMFRKVYPFSPALVQTLVAVSSLLQRERTALRIMLQLLVEKRDSLQVGDIVPVGDLFDAIAEGDEPFTQDMGRNFQTARRLYIQKLCPILEAEHGLNAEELAKLPADDAKAQAFQADDRILKTLLLAALVPEEESLRALTPSRLAALNHGTIKTPIPGREGQTVLTKCRRWAAQAGVIRISDESTNPAIEIRLIGVDTDSILEKADSLDNAGNRQRKIRELLFSAIDIEDEDTFFHEHTQFWRGTRRISEVVYTNIRELADDNLLPRGDGWKIVLDYPFDAQGFTPRDDVAKVQNFIARGQNARTVCWIPRFFTQSALKDLGTLVKLDHILTGERFSDYAGHLSQADRAQARQILEDQRSQLRQRVGQYLEAAYGIRRADAGWVDAGHEEEDIIQTLCSGFQPRIPQGADLSAAFRDLVDQMLSFQFPDHPKFVVEEVRPKMLQRVFEHCREAVAAKNNRIIVEREHRDLLKQIANPLELGEMTDGDAFILGRFWYQEFLKQASADGGAVTVGKLRKWIDLPRARGLTTEVQNLLIMVYAEQSQRTFVHLGRPYPARIEEIPNEVELKEQPLPTKEDWDKAVERLARILGIAISPALSASNVADMVKQAMERAQSSRDQASQLSARLAAWYQVFDLNNATADRLRTARASEAFLASTATAAPDKVVAAIASATMETSADDMARSIAKAVEVAGALSEERLKICASLFTLKDQRLAAATALLNEIKETLSKNELAVPLAMSLSDAVAKAIALFSEPIEPPPPPKGKVVSEGSKAGISATDARKTLKSIEKDLTEGEDRRLTISWRVEDAAPAPSMAPAALPPSGRSNK